MAGSLLEVTSLPYFAPGYENIFEELGEVNCGLTIVDNAEHCIQQVTVANEPLIVRTLRYSEERDDDLKAFEKRIRALHCGLGLRGLEQMVSYSPDAKTVVTKHAGTPLDQLSAHIAGQISLSDWEDALVNLEFANAQGLLLDTGAADNVTYSSELGLTFIDYVRAIDEGMTKSFHPALEFCGFLETTFCEVGTSKSTPLGSAWRHTGRKALQILLEHYPETSEIPEFSQQIMHLQNYLDPKQPQ